MRLEKPLKFHVNMYYEPQYVGWHYVKFAEESDVYSKHTVADANVILVESVLHAICKKEDVKTLKSQAASE